MLRRFCFVLLCLVIGSGCGSGSTPAKTLETAASVADEPVFESPAEKKYAEWSDAFFSLLVKEDYPAAYGLCSSELKSRLTLEQFTAAQKKYRTEFGTPIRAARVRHVNTDKDDLAGPRRVPPGADEFEANIHKLIAADAVDTLPDSVPVDIRRASVRTELILDPKTLPAKMRGDAEDGVAVGDECACFVTVVLVEEAGQLRAAHVWQRWPNMLD